MISPLQLTIAKLEVKQLEFIDKLSEKHNDYVIRIIQSSITDKFASVNGDWGLITGYNDDEYIDAGWEDIIPPNQIKYVLKNIEDIKKNEYFNEFKTQLKIKNGRLIDVCWKGKFYPEINGLVFIGRVKRK